MILKFEEWLVGQQYREDFVGDLARALNEQEVSYPPSGRKGDEHKKWTDIVIKMTYPGHIAAFNKAWQEFQLEKQDVEQSQDK